MKTKLTIIFTTLTSSLLGSGRRKFPKLLDGLLVVIAATVWLGFSATAHGQAAPPADPGDYAPGELLIKFKATATDSQLLHAWQGAGLRLRKFIEFKNLNHPGIAHVTTPLEVPQALRFLEKHPAIEYAEPNYLLYPLAVPNDPQFSSLWGLHNIGGGGGRADADIDGPEAWNLTTGSASVLIAVLDTGIDISHPDLAANIWTNPGEIPNDGMDNDLNGYVDDVNGWDFRNEDNTVYDPVDGDTHGTHVAGTIAAVGNNGIGVVGVNWQAKILPLKFMGPNGGSVSDVVQAIQYATANGAKVLNASFGGGPFSQTFMDAIGASGVLFAASAGNNGSNNDTIPFYPSDYALPHVIAVAATDSRDRLATFSNYGATSVDLGAPGVNILSTRPGNQYGYLSGTSMAAPHVAGVAGLIYARFPNLTATQVKAQILASVDPISALSGKTVTGGRLNAARAVVLIDQPPSVAITSPASGAVVAGIITLSATASDDQAVTQVSFYLDDVTLLASDANAPYEINWDSTSVAEGTHTITALATDTANQPASHTVSVVVDNLNDPPIANAGPDQTITDTDNSGSETVTLNGSASADPDGSIVAYEWKQGTTVLGNTATLNNVNALVGTSSFTLTVTDNEGASSSDPVQVIVKTPLHSGDLDGSSANAGKNWKATVVVTIHDGTDASVQGATVSIQWGGGASGTASLTTDANGRCTFISGNISKASSSATLSITGVSHATLTYSATVNHDDDPEPDGDSNGTSITVNKP